MHVRHFALVALALSPLASAQERVPQDVWMRYADPAQAGWSAEGLAAARAYWEGLDSAAWMVVENGVVVAAWGDCERRYMCHSVRKSFLSGLYGPFVENGTIDTEQTLGELGIDDEPALTELEKTARIEDLLRARSGVFKLAAYEPPQNPKPERGAYAPGEYWCYNNFDFNTLCTIFEQETGKRIFEEFDRRFAEPLGMQDFRVTDGYYHYELDKSIHPAYPFRMSARDCARYGLLFLNRGEWGGRRVLSEEWVARSTASYSKTDEDGGGYGYMWWTFDDPDGPLRGYTALGVGGQTIAVLPDDGLVIVNRTDTYVRNSVGSRDRMRLMGLILAARVAPDADKSAATLVAMPNERAPIAKRPDDQLARFAGTYPSGGEDVDVRVNAGVLELNMPRRGLFRLAPIADFDDVFLAEDIEVHVRFEEPAMGERGALISEYDSFVRVNAMLQDGAVDAALAESERALECFPMSALSHVLMARAFRAAGDSNLARGLVAAALELDAGLDAARDLARELDE